MLNLKEFKDQEEIINLLAECMYPDEERVRKECEQYRNDQRRMLLGKIENGKLIGIIGIIWVSECEVELKHIAVASRNRRQGLGKNMINDFIEENHIQRIKVETDRNAVNFYRKIGFDITSLGEKYPGVERFNCIKVCY